MKRYQLKTGQAIAFSIFLSAGLVSAEETNKDAGWEFGASIYGWFPDIAGQTASGDGSFTVDIENILENLEFTMMGTFEARKGRWGMVTDLIYMDVSGSKDDLLIEGGGLPPSATADLDLDMTSWICTLAGSFRALEKDWLTADVIAGTRYLDVDQTLGWSVYDSSGTLHSEGSVSGGLENWDAIIGTRGQLAFGPNNAIFVPFELDAGAGDSDLTVQAAAGLGYSFGAWKAAALWRHLYYDLSSDKALDDMSFSGPAIGAAFTW